MRKKNSPGGCKCCGDQPPCGATQTRIGIRATLSNFVDCTDADSGPFVNPCTCSRPYSNINGTYEILAPANFTGTVPFTVQFQWWNSPPDCCPDGGSGGANGCAGNRNPGEPDWHPGNSGMGAPPNHTHMKISGSFWCSQGDLQIGTSSGQPPFVFQMCKPDGTSDIPAGGGVFGNAGQPISQFVHGCCQTQEINPSQKLWGLVANQEITTDWAWIPRP